jgi:hypothetical protein
MRHHRILLISLLIILIGIQFSFAEYWAVVPVKGDHVNARMNHTAVLDTTTNTMYLFGGREYAGNFITSNQVYSGYQTNTSYLFSLVPTSGDTIPAREKHSSVIYTDTTGHPVMIVYGGRDQDAGKIYGDIFHLDLVTHQWTQITTFSGANPVQLFGHTAVWSKYLNSMIIFGGYDSTAHITNNVYLYNPQAATWTKASTVGIIEARSDHAAVLIGRQMFVYGGTDTNTFDGDLWKLDLNTYPYQWTLLTPGGILPAYRANHTMVYDSTFNRILVFGGQGGSVSSPTYFNDVYALDTSGLTWTFIPSRTQNPPSPRAGQSAIYEPGKRRMLMFAGSQDTTQVFDDLWEFFLAIQSATFNYNPAIGGTFNAGPAGRYQPQMVIPPGALTISTTFTISEADNNHDLPTAITIQPSGTVFDIVSPPSLSMQFTPQDIPDDSSAATMRIYVWDIATAAWVKVPYRQTINTTTNTITVPLYHLTDFGIEGSGHSIPTVEATITPIGPSGGMIQAGSSGMYTGHVCSIGSGAFASPTNVGIDYPADNHGWSSLMGFPRVVTALYSGNSAVVEFTPDTTLGSAFSIITVEYKSSDVLAGHSETAMRVYIWNIAASEWDLLPGSQTVNITNHTVSARIYQLGIFAAGVPLGTIVDNRWELYQ